MSNPQNKTLDWKRSYIRKAVNIRDRLTDKQLAARLNVTTTLIRRVVRERGL